MSTIDIGNWVRVGTKHCNMPSCYNCDADPKHQQFDDQKGILEHDFQEDLDCPMPHPGRAWSFEDRAICKNCNHGRVTIREEMQVFKHTIAVCFDGVHARFHSNELEDLGPDLGDSLEAQLNEVLGKSEPVEAVSVETTEEYIPKSEGHPVKWITVEEVKSGRKLHMG